MQQQHDFHHTATALPDGQPFTEPKNALRISHKSDHPRLQGWGEQHQTQGNFDNEKNRHSFKARPPACLQREGTQPAFCSSFLTSLQHTIAAFSSTRPQPLFVPSQLWEMRMGPAGFDSSAIPSPAPAEALGLYETLHETSRREGSGSPADAKRLHSANPRPCVLILRGLIVEMSHTSAQNEARGFSFQRRRRSSEPGSEPSFSLLCPPLLRAIFARSAAHIGSQASTAGSSPRAHRFNCTEPPAPGNDLLWFSPLQQLFLTSRKNNKPPTPPLSRDPQCHTSVSVLLSRARSTATRFCRWGNCVLPTPDSSTSRA